MSYEKLFTPFKIGKMEVKNRLVMSPMGTNSALANGRKTDNEIDYFIERAKGGVGMIIMGCQPLNEKIAQALNIDVDEVYKEADELIFDEIEGNDNGW